jgi:hypothetical protein
MGCDGDGQMRFSGTRAADKDQIPGLAKEISITGVRQS